MSKIQLQQGDVLIKSIDKLPEGCMEIAREDNVLAIMRGETTGHRHIIADTSVKLYELKGELYLEVAAPATITHDEHKAIPIPEGIYQIGRVKEYDYIKDMERIVTD